MVWEAALLESGNDVRSLDSLRGAILLAGRAGRVVVWQPLFDAIEYTLQIYLADSVGGLAAAAG
jgi:hypothetical protein